MYFSVLCTRRTRIIYIYTYIILLYYCNRRRTLNAMTTNSETTVSNITRAIGIPQQHYSSGSCKMFSANNRILLYTIYNIHTYICSVPTREKLNVKCLILHHREKLINWLRLPMRWLLSRKCVCSAERIGPVLGSHTYACIDKTINTATEYIILLL